MLKQDEAKKKKEEQISTETKNLHGENSNKLMKEIKSLNHIHTQTQTHTYTNSISVQNLEEQVWSKYLQYLMWSLVSKH